MAAPHGGRPAVSRATDMLGKVTPETPGRRGAFLPPTRSGTAKLVSLDDAMARALQPGDLVLREIVGSYEARHVARSRGSVGGDVEAQFECEVVESRSADGHFLVHASGDLVRVVTRGEIGT